MKSDSVNDKGVLLEALKKSALLTISLFALTLVFSSVANAQCSDCPVIPTPVHVTPPPSVPTLSIPANLSPALLIPDIKSNSINNSINTINLFRPTVGVPAVNQTGAVGSIAPKNGGDLNNVNNLVSPPLVMIPNANANNVTNTINETKSTLEDVTQSLPDIQTVENAPQVSKIQDDLKTVDTIITQVQDVMDNAVAKVDDKKADTTRSENKAVSDMKSDDHTKKMYCN